jgi:hypothetical protein
MRRRFCLHRHHDLAELAVGFQIAMHVDHFVEREGAIDHRFERAAFEPLEHILDRSLPAQGRFEWNLTSSTIMASAVSHQILRKPMADVEPMH